MPQNTYAPVPFVDPTQWITAYSPWSTDDTPRTSCDISRQITGTTGRVFCFQLDPAGNPMLPLTYWLDVYDVVAGEPDGNQLQLMYAYLNASIATPISKPDLLDAFTHVGFNYLGPPPPNVPLVYPLAPTPVPPIAGAPVIYGVSTPSGAAVPSTTPGATPGVTTPTPTTTPAVTTAAPSSGLKAKFIVAGGGAVGGGIGDVLSSIGSIALSFIPIIGGFLGGLLGGLLGGGTDLSGVIKALNSLQQQIHDLSDTMTQFTWSVANGLGFTLEAFAEVWDNFFDGLWTYMKQLWKLLWCIVDTIIPALIKGLRDLRKLLDTVFQKYIVPALKWLQRARLVLEILKALHVPLAAKLDSVLSRISGALFAPMYYVLRMLNGNGLWTNFMLAWDLTIQRPLFLRTMQKYQGDWINMWWNAQASLLPPGGGHLGGPPATSPPAPHEIPDLQQYTATGTGPYAGYVTTAQQITAEFGAGL